MNEKTKYLCSRCNQELDVIYVSFMEKTVKILPCKCEVNQLRESISALITKLGGTLA